MLEIHRPSRKALLVASGISAIASIVLFVTHPIPPVGLAVAIEAAVISLIFLWQTLFPSHVLWVNQKMDKMMKTKDDPNEPARWVP